MTATEDEEENAISGGEQDIARVWRLIKPKLDRFERNYNQALNRLWLGNAGAALATLSFIGATWSNAKSHSCLLWPFGLFVLGLIALGCGEIFVLIRDMRAIRRNQSARRVLDIIISDAESPLEMRGAFNVRLTMQCLSAMFFILGLASGLLVLYFSS